MTAVDRLKRDHKLLRSKLDMLESALGMSGDTWFVLRELCFTLSRQLRNHIQREEELVALCRLAMNPKTLAEVVLEHKDEPKHLRTINRLFVSEQGHSLEHIKPALTDAIQKLRHHMAEEERELFPILERTLSVAPASVAAPAGALHETMTVNRVLREFPATKPVLKELFINIPIEGCHCLDEVAWRRGLDAQELIERLEDVIKSCACTDSARSKQTESAPAPN